MRKLTLILLLATLLIALLAVVPAIAAPPCNGGNTGLEYAQNHIRPLATTGGLGNDAHKPGSHSGFSVCNPSGK